MYIKTAFLFFMEEKLPFFLLCNIDIKTFLNTHIFIIISYFFQKYNIFLFTY